MKHVKRSAKAVTKRFEVDVTAVMDKVQVARTVDKVKAATLAISTTGDARLFSSLIKRKLCTSYQYKLAVHNLPQISISCCD